MKVTSYHAYDVSWDGENILWLEGCRQESNSEEVNLAARCVNKALSKVTELYAVQGYSYLQQFYLLPNGYWTMYTDTSNTVGVLPAGKASNSANVLFSFPGGYNIGRIAFYNDRYWLGVPIKNRSSEYIYCADLTSNTTKSIHVAATY